MKEATMSTEESNKMMQVFQFDDEKVRVHLDAQGNPWWVAKDVCDVLDIANVSDAVSRLKPGQSSGIVLTDTMKTYSLLLIKKPDCTVSSSAAISLRPSASRSGCVERYCLRYGRLGNTRLPRRQP